MAGDPFRLAFDAALDFQLLVDQAGTILGVSEGYLQATRLPRGVVLGARLHEFPPYAGSERAIALLEGTLARTHQLRIPSSTAIPEPAPCAGGTVFTRALNTPLVGDDQRVNHIVHRLEAVSGVHPETPEERRFRKLVEFDYDAIVLSDAMGRVTFASPSIERITGYEPEAFLLRPRAADLHPDDAASAAQAARDVLSRPGGVSVTRLRRRHRDGTYRTIELTMVNYLHDPDVKSVVLTLHDVSEQAAMEENLRESQKLESLGVLAGGVAHDFNNILATILCNVGLVMEDPACNEDQLELLRQVDTASRRAADLCRQMLAYAGKATVVLSSVDLNRLIDETSDLLQVSIGSMAEVRLALGPDLPLITADATQLQQILMNLILNAADAIGSRAGTIRIRTRAILADRAFLDERRFGDELSEGTYVVLEVSDTGAGMSPEVQRRIFEPFFSTKGLGRGLGLAAVRGIVRSHGGAMRVSSEVGEGTTFTLLFPATSVGGEPRRAPELGAAADLSSGQTH